MNVGGVKQFSSTLQFKLEAALVAVRMKHLAANGGKHLPLIRDQIELDLRPAARCRRNGSAIRIFP
jgi:hypothetical protein